MLFFVCYFLSVFHNCNSGSETSKNTINVIFSENLLSPDPSVTWIVWKFWVLRNYKKLLPKTTAEVNCFLEPLNIKGTEIQVSVNLTFPSTPDPLVQYTLQQSAEFLLDSSAALALKSTERLICDPICWHRGGAEIRKAFKAAFITFTSLLRIYI